MVIKRTSKQLAKRFAKDFVEYLKKKDKLPVDEAYLFGSYSKGKQKDWSDIDVAIVSPSFKGKRDPYEYLWSRLRDTDVQRGIEPVGFHPKDFRNAISPLVIEIQKYGERMA